MKTSTIWIAYSILVLGLWIGVNWAGTTRGWFLTPIAAKNDSKAFLNKVVEKIQREAKGNVSLIITRGGEIAEEYHYSVATPISKNSQFGVSSVSKWVSAVAIMKLVEEKRLDLDAPVSRYLTRWQLPPSDYDNNEVTIRRLLSHTAGITDGLGHNGFPPGLPVQPLVEHLTLAQDREPDVSGKVAVGIPPGKQWKYSGGSYNLLQLVVEEVTGLAFAEYMQRTVFAPLGMTNTTFLIDRDNPGLADYLNEAGEKLIYPNYTSLAATGLYTTTYDLSLFIRAQVPSPVLSAPGKRILNDETLSTMSKPLGRVGGVDIWGAGLMLFAKNNEGGYIVGHAGKSPSLNSSVRLNVSNGNGIAVIQTGNNDAFASRIATLWTVWETGRPDMWMLRDMIPRMLTRVVWGSLAIILISIMLAAVWWRKGGWLR